jgi:hypothetical protein
MKSLEEKWDSLLFKPPGATSWAIKEYFSPRQQPRNFQGFHEQHQGIWSNSSAKWEIYPSTKARNSSLKSKSESSENSPKKTTL